MKHFLFRLLSPRSTFPSDITPEEVAIMQQHVRYWTGVMATGRVIAFGPVADPAGAYGIAIIRLEDADDPMAIIEQDPAIKAGAGFRFEVHPMPRVVCHGQGA